ncbi:MmcQ/YjbR family DNA-binding protein [bacterium]|nr:MAG: MmcQ/YjbR family DNA-binding protein [bacterium]
MDIEFFREYALKKKGTTDGFPFGESVLVFKVMGKMFMLMNFETPFQISLKCEPELAVELRERYQAVEPAFHMNKTHWNTVTIDGSVPMKEILGMIDHSYDLVTKSLTKKLKQKLDNL